MKKTYFLGRRHHKPRDQEEDESSRNLSGDARGSSYPSERAVCDKRFHVSLLPGECEIQRRRLGPGPATRTTASWHSTTTAELRCVGREGSPTHLPLANFQRYGSM